MRVRHEGLRASRHAAFPTSSVTSGPRRYARQAFPTQMNAGWVRKVTAPETRFAGGSILASLPRPTAVTRSLSCTGEVMEQLQVPKLLDEHGQPLDAHIESVLRGFVPKLRRQFPVFRDELTLVDLLETAGRRIAARQRRGPIERLHAYAWVALQRVAKSWLRRGANRLVQRTIDSESSAAILATVPAQAGSPEAIEQAILVREAMAHLTADEWIVCNLKMLGLSDEQIARRRGSTVAATKMVFSRAKRKLRRLLNISERAPLRRGSESAPRGQVAGPSTPETRAAETADGQRAPES